MELKVKSGEEYIPLSVFMQSESYRVIPMTKDNKTVYEISNYGRIRSVNTENGYHGSNTGTKNRCNILLDNNDKVRIFTGAISLNAFFGETFRPGDRIQYIDGNNSNLRLDNLKKIPSEAEKESGWVVNTIRNHYPELESAPRKKDSGVIDTLNIKGSKLLINAFHSTILGMFRSCSIPTPISLLYKNIVESSREIKDIITLEAFIKLIKSEYSIEDKYGQVGIKPVNEDIISAENKGYVSFRIAMLLKKYTPISNNVIFRKSYVVDKTNGLVVNFMDAILEDSNKFAYYPAPTYIELTDIIMNIDNVYVSAVWDKERGDYNGVAVDTTGESEESYYGNYGDYESAIENSFYSYLLEQYFENDETESE